MNPRTAKKTAARPWFWATVAAVSVAGVRYARRRRRRMDFRERVVVITGGSRGLGLEMARIFADEGARLALLARDEDELERARAELIASTPGADVLVLPCDVTDRSRVETVVDAIVDHYGHIDVLINGAGVIQVGPFEHMGDADFDSSLAVHFWGPLHLMRAVVPHMRARGEGRIVNISSIGGEVAVPHLAPYCAGKFALTGLSDALGAELARHGIRVTTVTPGLMRTGSHVNARFKGRHDAEYTWFSALAAVPGISMDARRAARRIVEACRTGDRHLTVGAPARLAELAQALAPDATAALKAGAARLLPRPDDVAGDREYAGHQHEVPRALRPLTRRLDLAARRNNELAPPPTGW